jgi:hypothetical protein
MENFHRVCQGQKLVKNEDFLDDKIIKKFIIFSQFLLKCGGVYAYTYTHT